VYRLSGPCGTPNLLSLWIELLDDSQVFSVQSVIKMFNQARERAAKGFDFNFEQV
jgi:hypothetical protein